MIISGLLFVLVAMIVLYIEINLFKSELLNADVFKPSDTSIFTNFGTEDLIKSSIPNSNKGCIFDPFIKLFHQGETGKFNNYYYVPSSFTTFKPFYYDTNSFYLGEYIIYHDFQKVFVLQENIRLLDEFSKIMDNISICV